MVIKKKKKSQIIKGIINFTQQLFTYKAEKKAYIDVIYIYISKQIN